MLEHQHHTTARVNKAGWSSPDDANQWLITNVTMEPIQYFRSNSAPETQTDQQPFQVRRARFFYDMQVKATGKNTGWNPIRVVGTNPLDGQFVTDWKKYPDSFKDINWYQPLQFKDMTRLISKED